MARSSLSPLQLQIQAAIRQKLSFFLHFPLSCSRSGRLLLSGSETKHFIWRLEGVTLHTHKWRLAARKWALIVHFTVDKFLCSVTCAVQFLLCLAQEPEAHRFSDFNTRKTSGPIKTQRQSCEKTVCWDVVSLLHTEKAELLSGCI